MYDVKTFLLNYHYNTIYVPGRFIKRDKLNIIRSCYVLYINYDSLNN